LALRPFLSTHSCRLRSIVLLQSIYIHTNQYYRPPSPVIAIMYVSNNYLHPSLQPPAPCKLVCTPPRCLAFSLFYMSPAPRCEYSSHILLPFASFLRLPLHTSSLQIFQLGNVHYIIYDWSHTTYAIIYICGHFAPQCHMSFQFCISISCGAWQDDTSRHIRLRVRNLDAFSMIVSPHLLDVNFRAHRKHLSLKSHQI